MVNFEGGLKLPSAEVRQTLRFTSQRGRNRTMLRFIDRTFRNLWNGIVLLFKWQNTWVTDACCS